MREFIVAEVSKNWEPGEVPPATAEGFICGMFEKLIDVNARRGYDLYQWNLHRLYTPAGHLNETIVAVFRKRVR